MGGTLRSRQDNLNKMEKRLLENDTVDENHRKKTKSNLNQWILEPRAVGVVGAPLSEGQSLEGVDLGPQAVREAGLKHSIEELSWGYEDDGDLQLKSKMHEIGGPSAKQGKMGDYRKWQEQAHMKKRFSVWFKDEDLDAAANGEIETVQSTSSDEVVVYKNVKNSEQIGYACKMIYEAAKAQAQMGRFVLTIGGDHSIAAGTITGVAEARPDLSVIWVDAHGDCNTPETSPSGNYHGMPVASILGWIKKGSIPGFDWLTPSITVDRISLIGLRDLDPLEKKLIRESGMKVFTMSDIDRYGIGRVMEMAIEAVNPKMNRPMHLSFDIDSIDPMFAPGTGTKARGGLTYREAHYICEAVAATGLLGSMDLVEINPALDAPVPSEKLHGDNPLIQGSPTVTLGVELICSALGKTIMP
eukprot:GILK01005043.1.p1 GENE.GILK01005043.1~~GILK01005043.1.p1  ORF type:complete len:414 (-),score=84.77 GILK01005043.1:166-1407(-)